MPFRPKKLLRNKPPAALWPPNPDNLFKPVHQGLSETRNTCLLNRCLFGEKCFNRLLFLFFTPWITLCAACEPQTSADSMFCSPPFCCLWWAVVKRKMKELQVCQWKYFWCGWKYLCSVLVRPPENHGRLLQLSAFDYSKCERDSVSNKAAPSFMAFRGVSLHLSKLGMQDFVACMK